MSSVNHSLFASLIGAAASLIGLGLPVSAHAETISNTATITWDAGAKRVGLSSNRVDLTVNRTRPAVLSAFQLVSGQGGEAMSVPDTLCQTAQGEVPVKLDGAFAGIQLSPATVKRASAIHAGEPIVVSLESPNDNLDPNAIDTVLIDIATPSGDVERIRLRETAANSNQFTGLVRTAATPPAPVKGDCMLSVHPGDSIILSGTNTSSGQSSQGQDIAILIDPYGNVFDSGDGSPVAGTRVTLIDAATGQPATVFGDDGVSIYPSSMIVGSTITDSSGAVYKYDAGDYRFPFARPGTYRLLVETPAPYTVPSKASAAELAGLIDSHGEPFEIVAASYGASFILNSPAPVRIDVPADRPGIGLTVSKTASAQQAAPGDAVQYKIDVRNNDPTRSTGALTITDLVPVELRLRKDTVRYKGVKHPFTASPDGRTLTFMVPALPGGGSGVISYLLEVRPDAAPGMAINRARAVDARGTTGPEADAAVRIVRESLGDRMTIIGRITDGGCTVDDKAANGVVGVRVMLEDGSFAVTDIEGRYHFEGVMPGLHVVQIDPASLPEGQTPADCVRNARSAGSAISRFVEGQGGALLRADFRTTAGENLARASNTHAQRVKPVSDAEAAGANRDWLADQTPTIAWLFPDTGFNPRTKAVRVAIRHLPGQTVKLTSNGKPVEPLSFEGTSKNGLGTVAVSLWRAIEIGYGDTNFTAEVRDENGQIVQTMNHTVHFSGTAMRAELVREKSVLVADGVTRPVIAVRLQDRDGKPIHHGVVGDFNVPAPYFPAVEADAQAANRLSGLERGRPVWRVDGDEGIAYIELEPTTASGALTLTLPFRDKDTTRTQRIEAWLTPGNRAWTVVGFAAGTAGYNTLEGRMEALNNAKSTKLTDGRLALYAKGRVKGQWLMTMAYDSDKKADEARFGGVIDPSAYYTIYADQTERRYDAASVRKLYVRLERPQFYALFGDYETAINEPQLARYNRSFNGLKAEFQNSSVSVNAFAADTPYNHRRQEIQGNGLTGPYALGSRHVLANSERIVLETRDRLRSEKIVDSQTLTRHIDYDIDYAAGTLRFREPILSRDSDLNPQFIVADYEVDGVAQRVTNAGGRARWTNKGKTLSIGATALHDESETERVNLGGMDVRYTPNATTEIRAEFAASRASTKAGSGTPPVAASTSTAWLVEAEHHGARYDVVAYARQQDGGFGVGQTNAAESGTRKFGVDGRARLNDQMSISGSAWNEESLSGPARRQAGKLLAEFRTDKFDARAGLTLANDRLDDGRTMTSTVAQLGASKRAFNNRLELDAQTEIPLVEKGGSIDFPARHKLSARYAVSQAVSLIGSYELADGKGIDARTARIGFDVKPWRGAQIIASANQQVMDEYGPRTFAAYGLSQSLPINDKLTIDLTVDGNKTLGGVDPTRVLNADHPVASGGFLGTDNTLSEDFTAVTIGGNWRGKNWSLAGRAEYRAGDRTDRYGFNLSALRQIGEGRAFGGAISLFRARENGGPRTETATAQLSWAHRPDSSRFAFLEKLELKSDKIRNAVAGETGPIGGAPLLITGNAKSQRIINTLSVNWSPSGRRDEDYLTRSEVSLFWGSRYTFDRIEQDDLKGWSNMFGVDGRFDLGKRFDIGLSGTVRQASGQRAWSWSGGPAIGVSPFKNGYVTIGYNVNGFRDKDFEDSRYTRKGAFVTLRMKFDQTSFAALGLKGRDPAPRTAAKPEAMKPIPMPEQTDDMAALADMAAMQAPATEPMPVAPVAEVVAPAAEAAPALDIQIAEALPATPEVTPSKTELRPDSIETAKTPAKVQLAKAGTAQKTACPPKSAVKKTAMKPRAKTMTAKRKLRAHARKFTRKPTLAAQHKKGVKRPALRRAHKAKAKPNC